MTKICPYCDREGHLRRTHWNCLENRARREVTVIQSTEEPSETPSAETTATPEIICRTCLRVGHSRTTHWNCGGRAQQAPAVVVEEDVVVEEEQVEEEQVEEEVEEEQVERLDIGHMNVICCYCGAFMWEKEKKVRSSKMNPKFQICCSDGKSILEPLTPVPEVIANLLRGNDNKSIEFKKNIRSYNSALSFTSMNADLDHNLANSRVGAYTFRIHGSVYHLMSNSLTPDSTTEGQQQRPQFAQIYFFDAENELQNRMNVAGNSEVDVTTMLELQQMMHTVNPFVAHFKTMADIYNESLQQSNNESTNQDIRMIFRAENTPDPRRYNSPTDSDLGVLIIGNDGYGGVEPKNRDIVIRLKGEGNTLSRINEINQFYDPLQYVLMFPSGDSGWNCETKSVADDVLPLRLNGESSYIQTALRTNKKKVSVMDFYSFRLMMRYDTSEGAPSYKYQVSVHSYGKLFHQFVVDMYAKMEQQRLNYIRYNQESLRAEVYKGLTDTIRVTDTNMSSIGKKIILPSSFIGGPRFMAQLYQDAISLVRRFGKPDLFITFTCNPAWPEIARELLVNQPASDRPDLCARVFNLKLKELLNDILKKSIFGKVVAYVYSIEFQKRGLPHAHMLFILDEQSKPRTTDDFDKIVSAEIPDPVKHKNAYDTVTTAMIHTPCGPLNPSAVCMKNGRCTKNFPREFQDATTTLDSAEGGYPVYRRRNNRVVMRNRGTLTVDNRWVVPHNLFLCAKYHAHINVEICSSVSSIKYIYKYVYKGHDRAQVSIDGVDENQDEVKSFLDARYVSASEACWRIFSFPMHGESPSHQRLAIHLEDEQQIYFDGDDTPMDVTSRIPQETTLTAWMKYNRDAHTIGDNIAKTLLYPDFCEHYTFHKALKPRVWKIRGGSVGRTVGRIYSVSPHDVEKYHLRILLYKIPGATCFADLRKYEGQVYPSYQATARAMGLLADNTEWSAALREASTYQLPNALRRLFCVIVAFCECFDLFDLWMEHRDKLTEDYLYREQQKASSLNLPPPTDITDSMFGHCLLDMNDILADQDINLKEKEGFANAFPESDTRDINSNGDGIPSLVRAHLRLSELAQLQPDPSNMPFNDDQKAVFNTICSEIQKEATRDIKTPRVYFIDAPGGSGKTFLFNSLLNYVRRVGDVAIAVASSGTAALLLEGGRTSHSTFKIPIDVNSESMCNIKPRSVLASVIRRAKLIVWDESSMTSKSIFEAVDRTFKDIFKDENPVFETVPFGGRLVVFGGDFRQVLPVIPKASRSFIINECINRSFLWPKVKVLNLKINMRVQQALQSNNQQLAQELQQFSDFLLSIGEGTAPTLNLNNNIRSDYIKIPASMHINGSNFLNLISAIYPNLTDDATLDSNSDYFVNRAILTPKNADVTTINDKMLRGLRGRESVYLSCDEVCDPESRVAYPPELLNSINNGSLPPHELKLKVGSPIMLLRNIDPAAGLCNGTRLIVRSLKTNIIEALIVTGSNIGQVVLIPRIRINYSSVGNQTSIEFRRTQFPVRLAFAFTINKSQGQTLENVGLYLPDHVFSHGHLYVALSRVKSPKSVKILINPDVSKIESFEDHYTRNIVYNEVFRS